MVALRRQKQEYFYEFKVSLVYIVSPRTNQSYTMRPCLKRENNNSKNKQKGERHICAKEASFH